MTERLVYHVSEPADVRNAKRLKEEMLKAFGEAKRAGASLAVALDRVSTFDSSLGQLLVALVREGEEYGIAVEISGSDSIPSIASIIGCEHDCSSCVHAGNDRGAAKHG